MALLQLLTLGLKHSQRFPASKGGARAGLSASAADRAWGRRVPPESVFGKTPGFTIPVSCIITESVSPQPATKRQLAGPQQLLGSEFTCQGAQIYIPESMGEAGAGAQAPSLLTWLSLPFLRELLPWMWMGFLLLPRARSPQSTSHQALFS